MDVALVWEFGTWLKCSQKANTMGKDLCSVLETVCECAETYLVGSMRPFVVIMLGKLRVLR